MTGPRDDQRLLVVTGLSGSGKSSPPSPSSPQAASRAAVATATAAMVPVWITMKSVQP